MTYTRVENKMEPVWALGLMSGTSLDGIDLALIRTDGRKIFEIGPAKNIAYGPNFQAQLRSVLGRQERDAEVLQVEEELTRRHILAVEAFLEMVPEAQHPKIIGFHGQTIFHQPPTATVKGETLQIGLGQKMAEDLGINVVWDFRSKDVLEGGHGAPLVPVFHQALVTDLSLPEVIVNIGGVANLTWIGEGESDLIAFDTGPGNALINDWSLSHGIGPYDDGGQAALKGTVDEAMLARWLEHAYFKAPYPKSLDRDTFSSFLVECESLSVEDGAATLTALTIQAIVLAVRQLPEVPKALYVSGGGRWNKAIMQGLNGELDNVRAIEDLGFDGDDIEAQAFAFLAVRIQNQEPISFPHTTGVPAPSCGGQLALVG